MKPGDHLYKTAGVDTDATQFGLRRIVERIKETWPAPGGLGAVKLDIGYFANVIDIGGVGLAICTDGVGSKSIIAQMMRRYDTVGIDCVAMNVNDVLCVGAAPVSMVDYIAVSAMDPGVLGEIAKGLHDGARLGGRCIPGGEIAQIRQLLRESTDRSYSFVLVGTCVGTVRPQRLIVGQNIEPGDLVIGIESSGIHSNGFTLARKALGLGE